MKDYYKILELQRSASIIEIRKAYRRLALKYHPDQNRQVQNAEAFILVNEAYRVLKNVSSKLRYDKLYESYILRQEPRNNMRFASRESARNRNVKRQSDRGRNKGTTESNSSKEKFERKTKNHGFWDGFSAVLEFFGYFLEVFI